MARTWSKTTNGPFKRVITDAERWDTLLTYIIDQGVDEFPEVVDAMNCGCSHKFEQAVDKVVKTMNDQLARRKTRVV